MSVKYNDKTNNREILLAGISSVDQILNSTSKNSIANKAVFNALKEKIDKTVSDLVNYYSKSDVYNKAEVRALISTISTMDIQVVNALPTENISTTTIYFLKPAGATTYDEYVYINNAWVKIGTTDLDLSQYVTNSALTLALGDYYSKAEIDTMLTGYAEKANYYNKDAVDALLDDKQDILTFDTAPIAGSTNPVTSGGVKTAIDAIQSPEITTVTVDGLTYKKCGKIVTVYGILQNLPTNATMINPFSTIPSGYSPANAYAISPLYTADGGGVNHYVPVGTLWFRHSGDSTIIYKPADLANAYVHCTYIQD